MYYLYLEIMGEIIDLGLCYHKVQSNKILVLEFLLCNFFKDKI